MLLLVLLGKVVTPDPGVACTDHSDCTVLGHKYGCLLYKCTDYTDPSLISCQDQEDCCKGEEGCQDPGKYTCVRTYLPPYPEGFCLLSSSLQPCTSHDTCSDGGGGGGGCCGEWCCPPQYWEQWQNFSCFSHQQCRAWHTGQYCCPDSSCCMSLPDYQDYYSYDYHTMQYSDDSYTTSTQYYDYRNSYGFTDNPFKLGGDTPESEIKSAFKESLTENDTNEDDKIDFFPVKDVFKNIALEKSIEENENESEEVDFVSLHDTSDEEDPDTSPDSTLHYEIVSNTGNPPEDVSEESDTIEGADDDLIKSKHAHWFPTDNVRLTAVAENITEDVKTVDILEESSSLGSLTIEEDLFEPIVGRLNLTESAELINTTSEPVDYEHEDQHFDFGSGTESLADSLNSILESVSISQNMSEAEAGSGLELPEEVIDVHVEHIIGEGSAQTDETEDSVIREGFEITTNPTEYSFINSEQSGNGGVELSGFEEDEVGNIKSVKVKVNVKSVEHLNGENEIVNNELESAEEFVSDIARQIETSEKEFKDIIVEHDIKVASYSGSRQSQQNIIVLCISVLVLSLNSNSFQE